MINYYSFIKQNVQLQEILNSFKDVDASSVFVHRALLISLPYGVDSSFIASLLYDSIAPRFFDGKTPVIKYRLNPDLEDDLVFFSDTLYNAQRFCFPFQGIYHIELPNDIQHHSGFLTEVLQLLQQYSGEVIPVFTIHDCDIQQFSRIKNIIGVFFSVESCIISLSCEERKTIARDIFSNIPMEEDAVDHLAMITGNMGYPRFIGACECLKAAAIQSLSKITDTYIKNFSATWQELDSQQTTLTKPAKNTIGFK